MTANSGITGLDAAGGISGNNYNITGVNQLTINDPGEGIVFSGTTNVQLFTIDDATDSILKITSATALDVNAKITNLSPGSANLDAVNYQQLTDAVAGVLVYQGTWNASTNSPALASGVGTPGYYYIVSTPGSTNLDGITDWNTGDWVIFSDQATDAWQKIDHTNVLNGAGTGNQVTKWSGAGTSYALTDSSITDNGTSVGIGTTLPGAAYKLEVNGLLKANGGYFTNPVSIFDSSATENPRLSLGRSSGETLNFDVEDRTATIYHKQDETSGIHKLSLSVDSDSVDTNTIDFNFRNSAGTTTTSTPMTILSSGRVGIGTASPSEKLEVVGDVSVTGGGNTYLNVNHGNVGFIKFTDTSIVTPNQFLIQHNYAQDNDFRIARNTGGQDFVIDSLGKVGIGTASPGGLLHVSSGTSGNAVVIIESDTDNNNENDNPQLQFKQDGGVTIAKAGLTGDAGQIFGNSLGNAAYFGNDENASVQFYTNATAALTIREDGDVGIGTTSPNSKLDIRRAGSGVALELIQTSGAPNDFIDLKMIAGNTAAGTLGTILRHKRDGAGGGDFSILTNPTLTGTPTEKLTVKSGGNVGIGTASPLGKLQVNDYTVASQGNQNMHGEVSIFANSGNESLFLGIKNAAYPNRGWAFNPTTNGINSDLQIKEHGSTGVRMAIQTGGNVGIGTTSPGAKLHIDVVAEDNQPAFKITKVSDSGENAMEVYHGTSSALRGIADFTNSLGSVMFLRGDGNVGIGTTSPSAKLDVRTANGNTQSLRIGRIDAASYWDFNHAGNDLRLIYNNWRHRSRIGYY